MITQVNSNLAALQTVKKQSSGPQTPEQKKLMKACTDFEAMMVQTMLQTMQSSQKMFGEGFGGEYFQSMFQEQMAKQIAGNGRGIGLAQMMYEQIIRSGNVK